MTSEDGPLEQQKQQQQQQPISAQDLQLVLRPKLGEDLQVLGCKSSALLSRSEHFACEISKLSARVKRAENETEEEIQIVAKSFPNTEYIKTIFNFGAMFTKEIFFYEKLLPAYRQLEEDFGIEEVLDVAPELYGVRRADEVDESVVLLMQNLKEDGYYTLDKVEGLDLSHSQLAIKTLARFHALGIACRQHRPEFWTEVVTYASINGFQANSRAGELVGPMFTMMLKDPRISAYSEKFAKFTDPEKCLLYLDKAPMEPWLTVAHCDFWTNNILYKKGEEGKLAEIKFIDFQNYLCNSPMKDLPYFLCTSTSREVMTRHFDELLDLYYETLIEILRRMRCDVTPFTRETFDAQLKIDANIEFFHNILAIKFFCAEVDDSTYDPDKLEEVILYSEINKTGYEKWYQLVLTYIEQGWL